MEPTFFIPDEVREHFHETIGRGEELQAKWGSLFKKYSEKFPDLAAEFQRVMQQELPPDWDRDLPAFEPSQGPLATRAASGKALNAIAKKLPELIGGSADLAPSTSTLIEGAEDFEWDSPEGRNMRFGVREHSMGAILNGISLHRGLIPYGATFLIFSDYMRPPMRVAALSELHVIYVFTHDSIGLGEDGPTHQPVEQLLGLRSVPNMTVIRPADANETVAGWKIAVERKNPVALILTRQKLPILDPDVYPQIRSGVTFGGYILVDSPGAAIILVATGSEVHPTLEAGQKLLADEIPVRVVSFPSWSLFREQPQDYQSRIFPPGIPILAVEAGVSLGWKPYIGSGVEVIGVDRFGASAPGNLVMDHYGFNADNIYRRALEMLMQRK